MSCAPMRDVGISMKYNFGRYARTIGWLFDGFSMSVS